MPELAAEVAMPTQVELLLCDVLDREWLEQSGRARPLERTPAVAELLELVLAQTGWGIHAAADVAWTAATPDALVAELRDVLPVEISPWTRRVARRTAALRDAPPLLAASASQPQLATATTSQPQLAAATTSQPQLAAATRSPRRLPASRRPDVLPVSLLEPEPGDAASSYPELSEAPEGAAARRPWRRRAPRLRVVVIWIGCILLGAVGTVAGGLAGTDFVLGAVAGVAAATLAALGARRS